MIVLDGSLEIITSAKKADLVIHALIRVQRHVTAVLIAEFVLFAVLLGLWIYRVPHALAAAKVLVIVLVAWYAVHEHISRRVFGGVTGDLAGFCISLSELITLAAAAIGGLIL